MLEFNIASKDQETLHLASDLEPKERLIETFLHYGILTPLATTPLYHGRADLVESAGQWQIDPTFINGAGTTDGRYPDQAFRSSQNIYKRPALYTTTDPSVAEKYAILDTQQAYGENRIPVVYRIESTDKNAMLLETGVDLRNDPAGAEHIRLAMGQTVPSPNEIIRKKYNTKDLDDVKLSLVRAAVHTHEASWELYSHPLAAQLSDLLDRDLEDSEEYRSIENSEEYRALEAKADAAVSATEEKQIEVAISLGLEDIAYGLVNTISRLDDFRNSLLLLFGHEKAEMIYRSYMGQRFYGYGESDGEELFEEWMSSLGIIGARESYSVTRAGTDIPVVSLFNRENLVSHRYSEQQPPDNRSSIGVAAVGSQIAIDSRSS